MTASDEARDTRGDAFVASAAPGQLLWDIGLGAGSVAIDGSAASVPARDRHRGAHRPRSRAARNATALGVPELEIVQGRAPEALAGLARPDAIFVGGGMMDEGVFKAAWSALKPGGRLVANAVSLETKARRRLFPRFGGDLIRLQVARADKVGGGAATGWRPAMPVMQWRVRKS